MTSSPFADSRLLRSPWSSATSSCDSRWQGPVRKVLRTGSMGIVSWILSALCMCGLVSMSAAQVGSNDSTFNPSGGADAAIVTIAWQPDGKVLIGGAFTLFDGIPRNCIARLHPNGSLDTSFDPGTGVLGGFFGFTIVYAVALQPDGKLLIGGNFTIYNGSSRRGIARLNSDGSLDASFNPGTGVGVFSGYAVYQLALQPDGKVLIGGPFTAYNGTTVGRIARLNPDGSLDTTFNVGMGSVGANGDVWRLALQPDGRVIIGGEFTLYNGVARNRIARLGANGLLDPTFDPGTGPDNYVLALLALPADRVLISGEFTTYNGTSRVRVARINANGSIDTSFNPGTGADNAVSALTMQPDGRVLIGGNFTLYDGLAINRIARINADGTRDTGFNPGMGADGPVDAICTQPDGKVLIGGDFTFYDGILRTRIARAHAYVPYSAFCPGDGTGAACPCANNGTAGRGCANSNLGSPGALLTATGNASIGTDTVTLTCTDLTGPGLFFGSNGVAGAPISFGDGLLCAAVGIVRMGVVFPAGNSASYPGGLTPNPVHIAGGITSPGAAFVQCWYRDAIAFCTSATYNLSNGLTILWAP